MHTSLHIINMQNKKGKKRILYIHFILYCDFLFTRGEIRNRFKNTRLSPVARDPDSGQETLGNNKLTNILFYDLYRKERLTKNYLEKISEKYGIFKSKNFGWALNCNQRGYIFERRICYFKILSTICVINYHYHTTISIITKQQESIYF